MLTPEIPLRTDHAIEIENPEQLPGAAKELLYTPDVDALVIRGFATAVGMQEQRKRATTIPLIQMIGRNIKYMREVNKLAWSFWEEQGYSDYRMRQLSMVESVGAKRGNSLVHTDYPATVLSEFRGPLSMSISACGQALYGIERPSENFRCADGTLNKLKWLGWKNSPAPQPGQLRTYLLQASSDAVLFVNHPTQSFHEVQALERKPEDRIASLYDYRVNRLHS